MRKLVFVTQTLDPKHGALAQTLDLVQTLSARVDQLVVIARDDVWGGAPGNVVVRTFDANGKAQRALAYERALAASLRGADGVLVHMVPTFAILAAPLTKAARVPLLLWYTHWNASKSLRLATRLVDRALSVDVASYPLRSSKVRGIGHAIDVERFAPGGEVPRGPGESISLIALGRTARWKGLATLVEAFRIADPAATLELRGPSLTADERAHREELLQAIDGDPRITLEGAVPREGIPELLRASDVLVSPAEPERGATLDKAVYEAAACARPVVTTNAALAPFLADLPIPLLAPPRNPAALAAVLSGVIGADASLRAQVGATLRQRVVDQHSLEHWGDAVIGVVREVRSARGG